MYGGLTRSPDLFTTNGVSIIHKIVKEKRSDGSNVLGIGIIPFAGSLPTEIRVSYATDFPVTRRKGTKPGSNQVPTPVAKADTDDGRRGTTMDRENKSIVSECA